MTTVSPRAENGRVHVTARPLIWSRLDAVARAVSTARLRLMLERRIVDLLVLALGLPGPTACHGLPTASQWVPPVHPPLARGFIRGDQEPGTGALNVYRTLVRSSEDLQR
jgi:hypothetical protein